MLSNRLGSSLDGAAYGAIRKNLAISPDYAVSGSIRATTMGFNGMVRNIIEVINRCWKRCKPSFYAVTLRLCAFAWDKKIFDRGARLGRIARKAKRKSHAKAQRRNVKKGNGKIMTSTDSATYKPPRKRYRTTYYATQSRISGILVSKRFFRVFRAFRGRFFGWIRWLQVT